MNSSILAAPRSAPGAMAARESSFRIDSELRHVSMIVYAVPIERVQSLAPAGFQLEEGVVRGRRVAWVSVISFLDRSEDRGSFEQTSYALHVTRNGEPAHWVLGISLGSLGAVATRNLWPLPWHLSAMEIEASFNPSRARYAEYGLRTQSEWANASWRIEDTGAPIRLEEMTALPMSLRLPSIHRYFTRRDGLQGGQRLQMSEQTFTRGTLRDAQCDLLERLGVLTREELQRPFLTALSPAMKLQYGAPSALGERSQLPMRLAA
ncbi:MAG: DUF2071 domain-containing protein [Blastocatellia bacterium]|nr:DUF2071 domain-containing protein [Blastocatellia bacterium]